MLTDAPSMTAPVAAVTTPDTVAVGVGVNTTSWALIPAIRLTLSDRGSKPGALVVIVALPTGRFSSSNRPSAPVVAVALPMLTDAPSMTDPVAAVTTPDTVAVGVGVNTTSWALIPATRLTFSDRGSKPGALVMIVALPTGRFASSNRPSAAVVAVALPIVTDAPSMTAPL